MIYVGIDVAKDKHDCFITNSDGEVLFKAFTISNNREGFETLFQRIESVSDDLTKVKERVKLKTSISQLVNILFPKLETLVPTLHMASVYALLSEFPSASGIASAHLTRLINFLSESSKGHYGKDTAILFREAARSSIGSYMPAKSLELKHTIKLIQELTVEIDEIESEIKSILQS